MKNLRLLCLCMSVASLWGWQCHTTSPGGYFEEPEPDEVKFRSYSSVYVGPHFNYVHLRFNNPNYLDGYAGGVTAGLAGESRYFFMCVDFEGTWNASSITGTPNQQSTISEYFADWNLGPRYLTENDRFAFGIFTGIGWDRFINTQDPNGAALEYSFDKLFIPAGFFFQFIASNHFQWAITGEYRPDVWSRLHIGDTGFNNRAAYAFRGQMPFKITFTNCCRGGFINIIPFYDWSKYGKLRDRSINGNPLDLPPLYRWYLGLRVLIGYAF